MPEFDEILQEWEADPEFQELAPDRKAGIYANWFLDQVKTDKEFASLPDERKQNILVNFLKERGVFDQPVEDEGMTYGEKWLHTPGEMLTRLTGSVFRTMGSFGDALSYTGNRIKHFDPQYQSEYDALAPHMQTEAALRSKKWLDLGLTPEEALKRSTSEIFAEQSKEFKEKREKTGTFLAEQGKIIGPFWGSMSDRFQMAEDLRGKNVVDHPEILTDPRYWFGGIADMLPSLLLTITPAAAAKKLALKLTPELAALVSKLGLVGSGIMGGALEGTGTYRQVLDETGDEEQAARAAEAMFLLSSGLNYLGSKAILKSAAPGFMNKMKKAGWAYLMEGWTEGLEEPAEVMSIVWSKILSGEGVPPDVTQMFFDSMKQAATVAPIAGFTGGGMAFLEGGEQAPTEQDVKIDEWNKSVEQTGLGDDKLAQEILEDIANPDLEEEPESWEMTAQQKIDEVAAGLKGDLNQIPVTYWEAIQLNHKMSVERALEEGKPVSQEVADSILTNEIITPSSLVGSTSFPAAEPEAMPTEEPVSLPGKEPAPFPELQGGKRVAPTRTTPKPAVPEVEKAVESEEIKVVYGKPKGKPHETFHATHGFDYKTKILYFDKEAAREQAKWGGIHPQDTSKRYYKKFDLSESEQLLHEIAHAIDSIAIEGTTLWSTVLAKAAGKDKTYNWQGMEDEIYKALEKYETKELVKKEWGRGTRGAQEGISWLLFDFVKSPQKAIQEYPNFAKWVEDNKQKLKVPSVVLKDYPGLKPSERLEKPGLPSNKELTERDYPIGTTVRFKTGYDKRLKQIEGIDNDGNVKVTGSEVYRSPFEFEKVEKKVEPKEVLADYPDLKPTKTPAQLRLEGDKINQKLEAEAAKETLPKPLNEIDTPQIPEYGEYEGIKVKVKGIREKTGEKVSYMEDAKTALEEVDSDIDKLYKVLECIG